MIVQYKANELVPESAEGLAYFQAKALLPREQECCFYSAPWSVVSAGNDVDSILKAPAAYKYVVTVCGSFKLEDYEALFIRAGITDVFTPYAYQGQRFVGDSGIRIWPFPSYPQYLKQAGDYFLCYDGASLPVDFIWSAVDLECLPVMPVDIDLQSRLLPGLSVLWDKVVTHEAYDNLSVQKSSKENVIEDKLHAVKQIKMLYGKSCFIYDIIRLFVNPREFLSYHGVEGNDKSSGSVVIDPFVQRLVKDYDGVDCDMASILVATFNTQLFHSPVKTASWLLNNPETMIVLQGALRRVSASKRAHFRRICDQYGVLREFEY